MKPLLSAIVILIGITTLNYCLADEDDAKIELSFVISARKLPDTDDMGTGSPDGYVVIEYSGSPSQSGKGQKTNTSILNNNHNPDWPEIFHVSYHPGKGQLLTFHVYDHNRFTPDVKMGSTSISVGDMVKAPKRKLQLDIVGPKKDLGKLLLFMKVNGTLFEDTEPRLRNKYDKVIHIGGHYKVKYVDD